MQAYSDSFAHIYNLRWGFFAERVAPKLIAYYGGTETSKQNKKVLDLCCGTGQLAKELLDNGYQVTGLDLSEPMLEHARQRAQDYIEAGQAKFIEGDAADFTLDETFGLVISTFDALNHLESFDALCSCFECVYEVTEDDGYFIFDLNTRTGLRRWSGAHYDNADEEIIIFTRGVYDEFNEVAYTQISGFLKRDDGLYERFEETVYNTLFEMAAVKDALIDIGWREVQFTRVEDLTNPIEEPEDLGRVFIIAKK